MSRHGTDDVGYDSFPIDLVDGPATERWDREPLEEEWEGSPSEEWDRETSDETPVPGRRPRLRRVLIGVGAASSVLLLLVIGGVWFLTDRYAGNLHHLNGVFAGVDQSKRPAAATGAAGAAPLTFLVVGSDTRADSVRGSAPGGRSDVMMVVRFTGDRKHAQVVSIPRDSWVNIPGHGMAKLNAAYAWGGPSLLIQTVEGLTGVRIDHYAAIDFQGFTQMTDALGGVDVQVASTTSSAGVTFHAGFDHLNGTQALVYVRQRHGLPGGDFDREKRQQQFLRAMFTKLSSRLGNVGDMDSFLRGLTAATSVDENLSNTSLLEMAYSMRSLRPADITFLTAPVAGTGREGQQSVVYLDQAKAAQLWGDLKSDNLAQHLGDFAKEALPVVPN